MCVCVCVCVHACVGGCVCVCVWKKTPPEKRAHGQIGFWSTKPGAGEKLLPLECRAKARAEGMTYSQTPVG